MLAGQDMIKAAYVRAQMTQIEKYNTAVNTFRNKYGYLPGDMLGTAADSFGFWSGDNLGCTGTSVGTRNGNGLIETATIFPSYMWSQYEQSLFWTDISNSTWTLCSNGTNSCGGAGLIDFTFSAPPTGNIPYCTNGVNICLGCGAQEVGYYIPPAKIGNSNYVYVYSVNNFNWYGIIVPPNSNTPTTPSFAITPSQAYSLDKKMDDGVPTTGNVQASYGVLLHTYCTTSNGPGCTAPPASFAPAADSATSCYNTTSNTYSMTVNNGAGYNCALSFKFQ
jgi:hypothetical protein